MTAKPYAVVMALKAVNMATRPVNAVRASLASLRGQAAVTARALGMHRVAAAFGRVRSSFAGLRTAMARLGPYVRNALGPITALLGAVGIGAMANLIRSSAEAGDELLKLAERTDLSVTQLQEWSFAARRSGSTQEEFTTGIRDLTKNIGEAVNGTGEGLVVFNALNIKLRDSTGAVRNTNDVMLDLADRMKQIPDAATRSAIAQKLFGESGGKMVVALNEGREGLAALFAEQKKYGQLTEQQARDATAFVDRWTNMKEAMAGVVNLITANMLPVLSPMISRLTEWVTANRELIATQVTAYIKRFALFMESINWPRVINGIRKIIDGVLSVRDFFGGWTNTLVVFAAVLHADLIVALFGLTKSLIVLGVQATLTAAKIAIMGLVQAGGFAVSFFTAMQYGVGVMKALNIAMMANPIGLLVATLAAAATAIYVYWDPIKQFFAALDFLTPVRDQIRAVASLLPNWLQDKLGLNVETSIADGTTSSSPSTGTSSSPASLQAPPPAGLSAALQQGALPDRGAQMVIRFENAPPGMRVASVAADAGLGVATELDYGAGQAGSGF